MRIFKHIAILPALLLLLPACSVTHAVRIQDRQTVSVDAMIAEVKDSRLILVGERHDVPAHHRLQLEVIKQMRETGKPVAIAMEMFEGVSQTMLDAWSAGKIPERDFVGVYQWNWRNLPWDLYRDILVYARDNALPVLGINAPRDMVVQVSRQGLASLNEKQLALLPPGVGEPMPEEYLQAIRSSYPVHGGNFRYICEAQTFRNRVMARRIDDYLDKHPDAVMVVIAGGGHVRPNGGIPSELKFRGYKVIIPPVPGMDERSVTTGDGNYLLEDPFLDWF